MLRLESPLFDANASLVGDQVKRLVGTANALPKTVVLDIGANADLETTSAESLGQFVDSVRSAGVEFAVADVRLSVVEMMGRSGLGRERRRESHLPHHRRSPPALGGGHA